VQTTNNNVRVGFVTTVTKKYAVEARDDLIAGSWSAIASNLWGRNTTVQITDTNAAVSPCHPKRSRRISASSIWPVGGGVLKRAGGAEPPEGNSIIILVPLPTALLDYAAMEMAAQNLSTLEATTVDITARLRQGRYPCACHSELVEESLTSPVRFRPHPSAFCLHSFRNAAIPEAWRKLVELLASAAESKAGVRADVDGVAEFLAALDKPIIVKTASSKQCVETNPTHWRATLSHDRATVAASARAALICAAVTGKINMLKMAEKSTSSTCTLHDCN